MHKVIDESQSVFVEGRNMLDSVLMANEIINDVKSTRKSFLVFKADFEKAWDVVG